MLRSTRSPEAFVIAGVSAALIPPSLSGGKHVRHLASEVPGVEKFHQRLPPHERTRLHREIPRRLEHGNYGDDYQRAPEHLSWADVGRRKGLSFDACPCPVALEYASLYKWGTVPSSESRLANNRALPYRRRVVWARTSAAKRGRRKRMTSKNAR